MAELTVQTVTLSGLEPAAGVAATLAGDTFLNNGRTYIEVTDGATTAPTVTVASNVDCNQGFTHDVTVAVTSGATSLIGPFPPNRFNDANGYVTVTYDDVTSVTVRVISY